MKIVPEFSDDDARAMTDEDHKELQVYAITQLFDIQNLLEKVFHFAAISVVMNIVQAILLLLK